MEYEMKMANNVNTQFRSTKRLWMDNTENHVKKL